MADDNGILFKNERRREGKNDPNAEGRAFVGGIWYWISAWTKEGKGNAKFQSLAFKEMTSEQAQKAQEQADQRQGGGSREAPRQGQQRTQGRPQQRREEPEDDEDVPF